MKHELYLDGKSFTLDGELPCTHVVIGQRDIEKERVEAPPPDNRDTELLARRSKFVHDEIGGRYALRPLEWAKDTKEAEKLAKQFAKKGWINVKILPVDTVIENA